MCGIAGLVLNKTDVSTLPAILEEMVTTLAHRGPDGQGTQYFENIGLGHRRLAIIDPAGGHQPLSNDDGSLWIIYNGELYNFQEIKQQLLAKGHRFYTNSDTEVVLHAYQEWGERCVEDFRGMFAFCILDLKARRLFLARDPLGIKPLVYLSDAGRFAFASEIQALRCLPGLELTLDLQALDQYLRLQYIPAPATIFKQIHKLPPAHRMTVTFDGEVHGPELYWQLAFQPDLQRSEADWLELIDQTLRDSVRAHLVSDVPFGAFLSGGVDSSAVVAYMAQILERPVQTFTIGFENAKFDETSYAQQVAARWETDHHVEIVRPHALEILPDLVRHYGEPFGDSSAIPTYYVSRVARQQVPMVLSGDGGDEAFAGYESYRGWMEWLSGDNLRYKPAWKRMLYPAARRILPGRYPDPAKRLPRLSNWMMFIEYFGNAQRQELWRPEYRQSIQDRQDVFEAAYARAQSYPPASLAQYLDIQTYLPFDILTKVDVASMMHGLEARTPIVDVRVMELAATIPHHLDIARSSSGEWSGKRLFKKVLERYYPAGFFDRPKMGFAVPIQAWLEGDVQRPDSLRQRLLDPGSALGEFFEPAAIQGLLEQKQYRKLWLLLILDEWLHQNRAYVSL
jgi:asparagine synthase (glutamine-hydrolysing)